MAMIEELTHSAFELLVLFFGVSGCILIKIDHKQPKPYMDEIFHIPQAQKYCEGQFSEWDPMITTLPGLYISSTIVSQPISWMFGVPMKIACNTFWLRSINVGFAVGNLILFVLLTRKIHRGTKDYNPSQAGLNSLTLATFPLLYFFSFLYYTDSGSTFFTMLMYLLSLYNLQIPAALSGTMAVMFRQTNIVWVVFAAGRIVAENCIDYVKPEKKDLSQETLQDFPFVLILFKKLFNDIKTNSKVVVNLIIDILKSTAAYIVVGIAFVTFVVLNGSIVVGAKNDHQAGLHFPQILYFVAFSGAFSFVHFLAYDNIKTFCKFLCQKPLMVFLICSVSFLMIWQFTFAHRYLLSDNRHYTFYVWSKIFARHDIVKYLLIPCYLFAFWSVCNSLYHQNILWKLVFSLCICINLVPSMLLEFRYFIIPYLFVRLHMKIPSMSRLLLEFAFYVGINGFTIYMFLFKPFTWQNESTLQRFMW